MECRLLGWSSGIYDPLSSLLLFPFLLFPSVSHPAVCKYQTDSNICFYLQPRLLFLPQLSVLCLEQCVELCEEWDSWKRLKLASLSSYAECRVEHALDFYAWKTIAMVKM